ncbi:MAG: ribosome-binding factor A [Deltaproteobacteria bacterium CG11_big_fil_rev_8_21_14_0_20_47_16]|nr:MAG: ribosome-binding factor A [Deltaproteobacteria bacterium CG11_big_fil_rev_8_21_14_0_20_47_16]
MKNQRKLPYDRCERVGDLILRVLSEVSYTELEDPRLKGLQFTAVKVTRDLQIAKIYYFVSGGEAVRKECAQALEDHTGQFRHALAQEMTTKYLPSLRYYFDESIEHGERIDALIAGLHHKS